MADGSTHGRAAGRQIVGDGGGEVAGCGEGRSSGRGPAIRQKRCVGVFEPARGPARGADADSNIRKDAVSRPPEPARGGQRTAGRQHGQQRGAVEGTQGRFGAQVGQRGFYGGRHGGHCQPDAGRREVARGEGWSGRGVGSGAGLKPKG